MIEPIDIAVAVHAICEKNLIPAGISPAHDVTRHAMTTAIYAKAINDAGVKTTGNKVAKALIKAAEWDMKSPWPGHPAAEKVIKILGGK